MMAKAEKMGKKLLLPVDAVTIGEFPDPIDAPIETETYDYDKLPADREGCDIGPKTREDRMVVVGRDVLSGLPIEMEISSEAIYEAMKSNLESICTSIKMILEKTPPELAKDIIHSGIYITGGGSKLQGLGQLFEQITGIKVIPSEFPEESAVRGLVKIVSESKYKTLPFSIK